MQQASGVQLSPEDKIMATSKRRPRVALSASFEGQPALGVVDEDLIHLLLRDAPHQHLRHDVPQDVRVAVAAVLGEAVLGVDVVRDQYLVAVALLHQERQAGGGGEQNKKGL